VNAWLIAAIVAAVVFGPSVLAVLFGWRWNSTDPTRRRNHHRGNRRV
jgi:Sec-independent protein translocase protein TatA